jgi:hypothetical protein
MAIVDNIADSFNSMGEIDLAGISLEKADHRLLDVTHMDLNAHVAMQPSAVAYYGSLLKDASRRLSAMKRQYERWSKKKYAEAKASLASGTGKSTVADIEARFIVDNDTEIDKWDKQIDKLQYEYDTMTVWYEAWRQKGFTIREYASITEDERYLSSSISGGESSSAPTKSSDRSESMDRVRSIINKKRGNQSQ